jgi:hypothetical protein
MFAGKKREGKRERERERRHAYTRLQFFPDVLQPFQGKPVPLIYFPRVAEEGTKARSNNSVPPRTIDDKSVKI